MTDITKELSELPPMPDPRGKAIGNAFIIERYYALVPRLALAERLLHGLAAGNIPKKDARAYLAHRAKEQS